MTQNLKGKDLAPACVDFRFPSILGKEAVVLIPNFRFLKSQMAKMSNIDLNDNQRAYARAMVDYKHKDQCQHQKDVAYEVYMAEYERLERIDQMELERTIREKLRYSRLLAIVNKIREDGRKQNENRKKFLRALQDAEYEDGEAPLLPKQQFRPGQQQQD